jgi:hypothetical protein
MHRKGSLVQWLTIDYTISEPHISSPPPQTIANYRYLPPQTISNQFRPVKYRTRQWLRTPPRKAHNRRK